MLWDGKQFEADALEEPFAFVFLQASVVLLALLLQHLYTDSTQYKWMEESASVGLG